MVQWQEKTLLEPDEKEKLIAFVTYFVNFYVQFLTEYDERLEKQVPKPGKWADFINDCIDTGKGATEGIQAESTKAQVSVGISVIQKCISNIGDKFNRDRLKQLINRLENFKNNAPVERKVLIESGIEIFESFASQFVQVTADGSWKRGLKKLAHDSVNRVLDFSRKERKKADKTEKFSCFFVTKGLIEGRSKKYKHVSTNVPHIITNGHTVKAKNSSDWNTAELFMNVGLITDDGQYYRSKKEEDAKYGYRLLFQWESKDPTQLVKRLKDNYKEDKAAGKSVEYKYSACLKEQVKNELYNEIFGKIGDETSKLKIEKDSSFDFQEQINEHIADLLNFLGNNFEELKDNLKQDHEELKDLVIKYQEEIKNWMKQILKECQSKSSIEITFPYLFDVRESVSSFTGREEKLKEITESFKINPAVVISGLGGVGKSELAVRYAHDRYRKGDGSNVLWINAETQETARDSYRNLLQELDRPTIDKDKAEKSLRIMAKEAHKLFSKKDSLFIFDNAEDNLVIKEFLPSSEFGFNVLITSQNKEVLGNQKCGKVEINILTENEAVDFVKKALGVNNDDQNAEIKELVKTLGRLPLALQHAVAYISASEFVDLIGDYVKEYAKSEEEIQKFLNRKGLDSYDKTIFITFKTAIDKVKMEEDGELAEKILKTVAYFSPDNIPKKIFFKLAEEIGNSSKELTINGKLSRAVKLIANYSLINLRKDQYEYLSIHRLVQEVIKIANTSDQQTDEGELLVKGLGLLKEFVNLNHDNAASCVPHIMSIWAHAYKHESLVKMFILDPYNNKATQTTPHFHLLIEGCSFEVVSDVIDKISAENRKDVISARNKYDLTPLHKALLRKDETIIQLLINVGADVNAKQPNGMTPLHFAAKNLSLDVVNALLENHAEVNAETQLKFTPLHFAAKEGHNKIVEALLAKNANVNAETEIKFTPLHLAAKAGHLSVVKILLNHKEILINARTQKDATPLHLAASSPSDRHLEVVDFLLLKNADVNAQNEHGFTPLHFAALHGHANVVLKLLQCSRTDVNARTSQGKKALDLARVKNDPTIIQALIDYEAVIFV